MDSNQDIPKYQKPISVEAEIIQGGKETEAEKSASNICEDCSQWRNKLKC